MLHNNPLQQYFRRPAIYLRLPSGGIGYDSSVLEITETGELPVYPMTALDEMTAKTPDALFNGQAMVDIVKSCIPNIKNPWQLKSLDLDAILIAIKTASNGSNMEVESQCPKCDETSKYDINLSGVLTNLKTPDYNQELKLGDLLIKIKPLTYKEMNDIGVIQFEIQKQLLEMQSTNELDLKREKSKEIMFLVSTTTMKTVSQMIEYIKTPVAFVSQPEFIYDFLQNCDSHTYDQIREFSTTIKDSAGMKPLTLRCTHCQHEYDQTLTLNLTDFFA